MFLVEKWEGVKIPFSFSSKQNGYSAIDQINVMKLRLPRWNLITVNPDVIGVSNRVVSPTPKKIMLCHKLIYYNKYNFMATTSMLCSVWWLVILKIKQEILELKCSFIIKWR